MKRKNVWVTEDGTEFEDQTDALEYERNVGFHNAVVDFIGDHLNVDRERAEILVVHLQDFLHMMRDNAEEFQEVLELAKPKKPRGRPKSKNAAAKKPETEEETHYVESEIAKTGIVAFKGPDKMNSPVPEPKEWRAPQYSEMPDYDG